MTTVPSVTALIPTFNRAQFLGASLDSVLRQTLPPAQVVVINDGSTDNTREIVGPYMSRIEYLEKPNGGKSSALNLGLSRVTGDYVWILDDDDVAFPDLLERHLRILEANRDVGFTYSGHLVVTSGPDGTNFEVVGECRMPEFPEDELLIRHMEGAIKMLLQGAVVRTSCYREVGLFDTEMIRSQDHEMFGRLLRSFHCARVSGPTFYLRQHSGLRGAAEGLFPVRQNDARWRQYHQIIYKRIRHELPLREYLPRSWGRDGMGRAEERRAYLQRMAIMAANGFFEEMLEDLKSALADGSDRRPLTDAEQSILWLTMSTPLRDDAVFKRPEYLRRMQLLCWSTLGRQVQFELARGLFWRFSLALRLRDFTHAFQLIRSAWWLVGFRRAATFAAKKLAFRSSPSGKELG